MLNSSPPRPNSDTFAACKRHSGDSSISTRHIFFDNNALAAITKRRIAHEVRRTVRASWLDVQATELNLVENYSAPALVSEAVKETVRILVGHDGVLPWIGEILKIEAETFLKGERAPRIPLNSLDTLEPGQSWDQLRANLNAFRKRTDESHRRLHADARKHLQPRLKAKGIRPEWHEFPAFLEAWQGIETREIFARQTWRDLDLLEPFQPEILSASESWRLMADADAIAIFQGALAFTQPRQVQRMDQLQLPYLGGADRRILVTMDEPFAEAGKMVVNGRYHLALVVSFKDFLEGSGVV